MNGAIETSTCAPLMVCVLVCVLSATFLATAKTKKEIVSYH